MIAQKIRVARWQLHRLGQQQPLRRRAALFQATQHLLEQNPLVRRVLIEQHQAALGFEHHIQPPDHAHQAQRHREQRHRRFERRRARTRRGRSGRGRRTR